MGSNTYLVYAGSEGMIVDCGNPLGPIKTFALENEITIKYIVLTHGHYDHASRIEKYLEAYPDAIYTCHEAELDVLIDTEANVSELFGYPMVFPLPKTTLHEGSVITLGKDDDIVHFTVLSTPGHTPGSICMKAEEYAIMITGDTIFANGGYGRTDFKYGDTPMLAKSLHRILDLDPQITILPGHGGTSTIGEERY